MNKRRAFLDGFCVLCQNDVIDTGTFQTKRAFQLFRINGDTRVRGDSFRPGFKFDLTGDMFLAAGAGNRQEAAGILCLRILQGFCRANRGQFNRAVPSGVPAGPSTTGAGD